MIKLNKIYNYLASFVKRLSADSVYAISGHATLFMIISFFPMSMLLLSTVKYMPFSKEQVITLFDTISMGSVKNAINFLLDEIYNRSNNMPLSLSAIALLWSASTSVYSIILGLNRVYNHKETRNYFLRRSLSLIYTLIFIISIIITLVIMVFGKSIIRYLLIYFPIFRKFNFIINFLSTMIGIFVLILLFDILYTIIPNRRTKLTRELPGAIFASLGWYLFSFLYALYVETFSNYSFVYGSLAAIVLLMIWLYFCMYIFFIGAEVNQTIQNSKYFNKIKLFKRKKKNAK